MNSKSIAVLLSTTLLFTPQSVLSWVSGKMHAAHHGYPDYIPRVFGINGQDCTPDTGDFPAMCPDVGMSISVAEKIECIHNFDCCTCGTMYCGPDCSQLMCNGDSSCHGVQGFVLEGNAPVGTDINCNGDLSCMETRLWGTNIAHIGCTGDGSCAYSQWDVTCVSSGCTLACVGDDSCRSELGMPQYAALFVVRNSLGFICASHACQWGTYSLLSNLGGKAVCGAERACQGATVNINNIDSLGCNAMWACGNATILVLNPQNGFSVSCNGFQSCKGMTLEIAVTDPSITDFLDIACVGPEACADLKVTITKVIPVNTVVKAPASRDLTIGEITCGGALSCQNAVFDLGSNVHVELCGCAGGNTRACEGLLGIDSCMQGLEKMECVGVNGCANMMEAISNPADNFKLFCADPFSCENLVLTVKIDDHALAPSFLGGVVCAAPNACKGLRFFIINTGTNRVNAGDIFCNAPDACLGAAFVVRQADISSVTCAAGACPEYECSTFTDNQYQPCLDFKATATAATV